ncbi:MAG TPA: ferric reductase-like transmembrane domain-containing protein [Acidimicrobiales bacterium]|nr:ferric reductase-like transmembrane domain-containing protein [Acidimicrobiales bacterium]
MIATSSQYLWYTTRATGVVALLLLTGTVVLGVLTSVRFGTAQWPRFALQEIHRRVALLSMVFIALHVLTTVTDSYAPIGWVSVFVPFTSSYRRLWLGLGAVAVDLLLAVTISSLLRQRISHRVWRALHWLAYASWPVALLHGLGTGTDPRLGWMVLLTIACVTAVLAAVGWRITDGWPARAGMRVLAGAGSVLGVIGIAAWTASGPLRPGWAARAGTPASLLGGSQSAVAASPSSSTAPPSQADPSSTSVPAPPFTAAIAGTASQSSQSNGLEQVDLKAQTQGSVNAVLDIVIIGSPDSSGGIFMQQSRASFGPPEVPGQYEGSIVALEGSRIVLSLQDRAGGSLFLRVDVSIVGTQLTGQLESTFPGAGSLGDDH